MMVFANYQMCPQVIQVEMRTLHSKNLTGLGSDVAGGGVREQGSHFPSRGSVEQTPQDSLCSLSLCSSGR